MVGGPVFKWQKGSCFRLALTQHPHHDRTAQDDRPRDKSQEPFVYASLDNRNYTSAVGWFLNGLGVMGLRSLRAC